jgi:hypothetical protein
MYPTEMVSVCQRDICNSMFIAALFTRFKKWKQPHFSLTNECIKVLFVTMYTELEIIMSSEISQEQKDNIPLICAI